MTTQPEALLCAEWLEVEPCAMDLRCAAELRRLHGETESLRIERLRDVNRIAALEKALGMAVEALERDRPNEPLWPVNFAERGRNIARKLAVIKAARQTLGGDACPATTSSAWRGGQA